MDIQILVDNPDSWLMPYAQQLVITLDSEVVNAVLIGSVEELEPGEILVMLGCETILDKDQLALHEHNLVVHESDLPEGRGWSPLTWQILEGKDRIPVTLFEAEAEVDSGQIYGRKWLEFDGTELIDELREHQARATIELVEEFIDDYPEVSGTYQEGEPDYYPRRTPEDSELDPDSSLREQFDLLRVVDNEMYPAFFELRGERYEITISKADDER